MSGLSGAPTIGQQDLYTSSTTQGAPELGQLVFGDHGKAYRYVKAGEALVVGTIVQGPAVDTQFDALATATAGVAGDMALYLTNGTTAVVLNELVGAVATITVNSASGTNLGEEYTVTGNIAAANGAALTLYIDRPLRTATTTSTTKTAVRRSQYNGVIKAPVTTLTAQAVGVAIYPIASGEYGWIQTHGVASVKMDGTTIIVGSQVASPSPYTAGFGTLAAAASGAGQPSIVGNALMATASGQSMPIFLKID